MEQNMWEEDAIEKNLKPRLKKVLFTSDEQKVCTVAAPERRQNNQIEFDCTVKHG